LSTNTDDKDKKNIDENFLINHDISKKLGTKIPSGGLIRLKGYVGSSDSDSLDTVTLYLNLNFDTSISINKKDIVRMEEAPESELEFGGIYVWIPKNAEVVYSKTESSKEQAKFLEGEIAKSQLKPTELARIEYGAGKSFGCPLGIIDTIRHPLCPPLTGRPCTDGCGSEVWLCPSIDLCTIRTCNTIVLEGFLGLTTTHTPQINELVSQIKELIKIIKEKMDK
jgi:hypothetical protein